MMRKGYYIEYHQQGSYIKVTAIDPDTGTEVSIVGDAKASQDELNRLVIRKLEWKLGRDKSTPAQSNIKKIEI